jgi:AcrR family transcriptional regulator
MNSRGSGISTGRMPGSYRRELLLAAMTDESASPGFQETTVARLAARAGISRAAFYKQFANKEGCFLAAFDELFQRAFSRVTVAFLERSSAADRTASIRAGVAMLFELVRMQPEAAKLCLVMPRGASPRAAERLDGAMELWEAALGAGRPSYVSPMVVTGLVGGIYRVVYERLRTGREQELPTLVDDLVAWMGVYEDHAPPRSPAARRDKPTEERRAEGGLTQVANDGSTPTRAAQLAAYDIAIEHLLLIAADALHRASNWPSGVRKSLGAITELLSREPALLELITVEILALGELGRERDAENLAAFARLLSGGDRFDGTPGAQSQLVEELIAGGIREILHRHAVNRQGQQLPERADELCYLVLAPGARREQPARARIGGTPRSAQPDATGSGSPEYRESAWRTSSPSGVGRHA